MSGSSLVWLLVASIIFIVCGCAPPTGTPPPPMGTSPPPTGATPVSTDDFTLTFRRTGGIAAIDEQLTVRADGSAQLDRSGTSKQFKVSADQLAEFKRMVEKADFFNLKPEYMSNKKAADLIEYTVSCKWGNRQHAVRTETLSIPDPLEPLIVALNNLATTNQ